MGVLREVVASFAVHVDDRPLTRLDRKINIVKERFQKLAQVSTLAFTGAAFVAYRFVTAASDAQETLNQLNVTFKENAAAVIQWSRTYGQAVGRSEFTLQESVSRLGALLGTVLKGTEAPIDSMAKKLSELAVDLASFWNTTDAEALMRIQSGLMGETEAVRRYGIDVSDSALRQMAEEKGIKGQYKSLSVADKTLLRFEKMVRDSTLAQGDAARTAHEWANQIRRFTDRIKDLSVRIGRQLMPVAFKLLGVFHKVIDAAENLRLRIGNIFEAAVITGLVAVTGKIWLMRAAIHATMLEARLLIGVIWAMRSVALKMALAFAGWALPLTAVFLIVEDVLGAMKGMNSATGEMIRLFTGIEDPAAFLRQMWREVEFSAEAVVDYMTTMAKLAPEVAKMLVPGYGVASGAPTKILEEVSRLRETRAQKTADFENQYGGAGIRSRTIERLQRLAAADQPGMVGNAVTKQIAQGFSKDQLDQMYRQQRSQLILQGKANVTPNDVAIGIVPKSVLSSPILTGPAALNEKGLGFANEAAQNLGMPNISITNNVSVGAGDPKAVGKAVGDATTLAAEQALYAGEQQRKREAAAEEARRRAAAAAVGGRR